MDKLEKVLRHARRLRAGAISTAKGPCNSAKLLARIVAFDEIVMFCESLQEDQPEQRQLEAAA